MTAELKDLKKWIGDSGADNDDATLTTTRRPSAMRGNIGALTLNTTGEFA